MLLAFILCLLAIFIVTGFVFSHFLFILAVLAIIAAIIEIR